MKRQFAIAGAAVLVAGTVALTTGASDQAASPPDEAAALPSVLKYLDIRTQTEFLDLGRLGGDPSPGDAYYFGSDLAYAHEGDAVSSRLAGRFVSTCVFVVETRAKCSGALLFEGGTIEIAGTPDFGSADPIAAVVVGGTGRYSGVSGTVAITPTKDEGVSRLVVRFEQRRR